MNILSYNVGSDTIKSTPSDIQIYGINLPQVKKYKIRDTLDIREIDFTIAYKVINALLVRSDNFKFLASLPSFM